MPNNSLDKKYQKFLIEIGKNIKSHRKKLNLKQKDFDYEPNPIENRNWRRIELGNRNFTMKTLFNICKKLNCQPKDLFDIDFD